MGKVESALKDEITRLARKVARHLQSRTVEEVRRLKKRVAELQSEVTTLKKAHASALSKSRMAEATQSVVRLDIQRARLSPLLIKKLRKRMKISQPQLASLLSVSPAAVGFWESGKSQPRPDTKARIVALRKLGRRDVRRLLDAKQRAVLKKSARKSGRAKKSKARKRARK